MALKLDGKVAVVTGGSSGLGLATARRFVEEGAFVFITGRRQKELDDAVRSIGRNISAVQGDMAVLADIRRLYTTVREQKGKIDIVFANAVQVRALSPRWGRLPKNTSICSSMLM